MTDARAWPIRPKWHRFETPKSYARRQCAAAGIPFDYVERGLTTERQPYIYRVWADEAVVASTIEAAAGCSEGHVVRLKRIAQPDSTHIYPERFLCRLCAAGSHVEQIPHDRENWCLKHPGQLAWVGPGTTPESQVIIPYDRELANPDDCRSRRGRGPCSDRECDCGHGIRLIPHLVARHRSTTACRVGLHVRVLHGRRHR